MGSCLSALFRIFVALVLIAIIVVFIVVFASFALPILVGFGALLIIWGLLRYAFGRRG